MMRIGIRDEFAEKIKDMLRALTMYLRRQTSTSTRSDELYFVLQIAWLCQMSSKAHY